MGPGSNMGKNEPVGEDDAVGIGVEDADEGVGLDEGLDLVEDERPFEL